MLDKSRNLERHVLGVSILLENPVHLSGSSPPDVQMSTEAATGTGSYLKPEVDVVGVRNLQSWDKWTVKAEYEDSR